MRILTLVSLLFALFSMRVQAANPPAGPPDEGMWLPMLISQNYDEMKRLGFELTPEQVYSVNNSSLKDAIVHFGGFCTGEIISAEGLVLTNHHCGFDAIQSHSTVQNDYLTDGFWAMKREDELPNPGLTASFLVRMEDVTTRVKDKLKDAFGKPEAAAMMGGIFKEIVAEATKDNHYNAVVKDMYQGSEFYLFVYETFQDVRLVGAPPGAVGKFGGDTDNWMWPRHTGDFSMFRIYAGKDGKPAAYSKDNVPMKPRHSLPVCTTGVKESDFAMVFGFPGRTQRYLSAEQIKMTQELSNPARIKARDLRLKIWKEDMDKNDEVRIKYASKHAQISNYWKYFIGQNKGLKRLKTVQFKADNEKKFNEWANANTTRAAKYGKVIDNIASAVKTFRDYTVSYNLVSEALLAPEIVAFALNFDDLEEMLIAKGKKETVDDEKYKGMLETLKKAAEEHYKDYNAPTDQKLLAGMFRLYAKEAKSDQRPDIIAEVESKMKGDYDKYAASVFAKSMFKDKQAVMDFIANPNLKKLQADPAFKAAKSCFTFYQTKLLPQVQTYMGTVNTNLRVYIEGLREFQKDKKFYPDANSTMRLTYGQVKAYKAMDAVNYNYYTTLDGVIEKEDATNEEFVVPKKLMDLYKNKDYGRWAENGVLKVCFITTNDITGGNSGSPVINGKGELIGLAFDGNWEAMTGDLVFDAELKRTINVDIRYVMFIIDKYAGAGHLLNEMKLVGR